MNYRHIYHAGNFADVVKHTVLVRVVEYLKRKPGAFRVIDTHAGTGIYDLSSEKAQKTGEWRNGIGRLLERPPTGRAAALLAPYLEAVGPTAGGISHYPGSPVIVRRLLRSQDRLTALELHPQDAARLKACFSGDFQVRVIELDGWLSMKAHLPPKEKRGLVLIDPPFEAPGEFDRIVDHLRAAHRRWPGGTYLIWYPIKDRRAVNAFRAALKASGIPRILDVRLTVRETSSEARFEGTGLIAVNAPFVLEDELAVILPALRARLAETNAAASSAEWLAGEAAAT